MPFNAAAVNSAHSDGNQQFSSIGVIGTLGTADTAGSALTLPFAVNPLTGAAYVHISGTDVNIGGGGGTSVNIVTGTQQTLGTVGTVLGIGGTVQVSGASAGTNVNIITGSLVGTLLGGTLQSGTINGTVAVEEQFSYFNATAAGTTTVKSSAGLLHTFVINTKSVGGSAILYDNTAASGTKIANIDTTLTDLSFVYDVRFLNGLTVVWAGNTGGDITVSYR